MYWTRASQSYKRGRGDAWPKSTLAFLYNWQHIPSSQLLMHSPELDLVVCHIPQTIRTDLYYFVCKPIRDNHLSSDHLSVLVGFSWIDIVILDVFVPSLKFPPVSKAAYSESQLTSIFEVIWIIAVHMQCNRPRSIVQVLD
jgi:hypothetical protein